MSHYAVKRMTPARRLLRHWQDQQHDESSVSETPYFIRSHRVGVGHVPSSDEINISLDGRQSPMRRIKRV